MRIAAALALSASIALTACTSEYAGPPPCNAGMPPQSQFLRDPAFATLKSHSMQEIRPWREFGYDLWSDADYTSGLEYALAPTKDTRNWDDLCAFAITLRFAVPPKEIDQQKLHLVASAIAQSQKVDPKGLEAQLEAVIRSGDELRPRPSMGPVKVEAGQLVHQTRGPFFMVTFTWPRPAVPAK